LITAAIGEEQRKFEYWVAMAALVVGAVINIWGIGADCYLGVQVGGIMKTAEFMTVEEYLECSKWKPDAEYVDGVIEERSTGSYRHSMWQGEICFWFGQHAHRWNVRALPSLRIRVANTRIRVRDVSILDAFDSVEQIPTVAPFAVLEVLSPEDTVMRYKRKLADYATIGIPHKWVIDPEDGQTQRYVDGCLVSSRHFELPTRGISFDMDEIPRQLV
jgi:Uma2 family endonuclease